MGQKLENNIRITDETKVEPPILSDPHININRNNQENPRETEPNKKSWNCSCILNGAIGGMIVILFLVFLAFIWPGFRISAYYINEDPSLMLELLNANITAADSIALERAIQNESIRRQDLIKDLVEQKVIVSSEDFASNLSSYYNALIAVLAAILIILNLVGYFSWRSNANSSLEQKQRELDDAVKNIDDRLEKNLEDILRKNQAVKERLQLYFRDLLDQREKLEDEEWDKLHLLLAKYKKQEVLMEIEDDNNDSNDGEIEG